MTYRLGGGFVEPLVCRNLFFTNSGVTIIHSATAVKQHRSHNQGHLGHARLQLEKGFSLEAFVRQFLVDGLTRLAKLLDHEALTIWTSELLRCRAPSLEIRLSGNRPSGPTSWEPDLGKSIIVNLESPAASGKLKAVMGLQDQRSEVRASTRKLNVKHGDSEARAQS